MLKRIGALLPGKMLSTPATKRHRCASCSEPALNVRPPQLRQDPLQRAGRGETTQSRVSQCSMRAASTTLERSSLQTSIVILSLELLRGRLGRLGSTRPQHLFNHSVEVECNEFPCAEMPVRGVVHESLLRFISVPLFPLRSPLPLPRGPRSHQETIQDKRNRYNAQMPPTPTPPNSALRADLGTHLRALQSALSAFTHYLKKEAPAAPSTP